MSEASPTPSRRWLPRVPGPLLVTIAIFAAFLFRLWQEGLLANFLSLGNLQGLLHDCAVPGVAALGMLLIIVSGGIDLSVGSVLALVSVATMLVYRETVEATDSMALASLACVAAGIGVGGLCGLTNGLIITRLHVMPFVTTLGMMSIARGLAVWLSDGKPIFFRGARPGWVSALAIERSDYLLFSPGVWSLAVLAILVALLLRFSVFGRHCFAIGSNEATARLCGIDVGRRKLLIYGLAGLLTGWAGVLEFTRSGGDPIGSQGRELEVIAAVVIGGASLSGGQGTVSGTLLGVLLLTGVERCLSYLSVPVEMRSILLGAIFILNTALGQWQRRREAGAQ